MKKILVYYYNEELTIDSNTSVTRLVASLMSDLKNNHEVYYFTFDSSARSSSINAHPVFLNISRVTRLKRKFNNMSGLKRIHWYQVKQNMARKYIQKTTKNYDVILVLGLDDVKYVRKYFHDARIFYWIHNISAISKKEYLYNINSADYFLSPSRTTYKLLLENLRPVPLTAEFRFFPNWCEDVFKLCNEELIEQIKRNHQLKDDTPVFIFSGSDLKLKGRFIIEKVVKALSSSINKEILFFFAGGKVNGAADYYEGNIRIINVGVLSPGLLAAYYHVADFGCFASLGYDHCPLTLLEMVACNVMPIASDVGSVKEILGDDYRFLIDEPHSIFSWIKAIEKVLDLSGEERERVVCNLKDRISGIYDKKIALSAIEALLSE